MQSDKKRKKTKKKFKTIRRFDIYFLPSFLTSVNAILGFLSIIYSIRGKLYQGAIFIFLAAIFDWLDGRAARFLKASSQFGAELDSLSDAISFGVAPAILAYQWGLWDLGTFANVVCAVYALSGILRLARFNVMVGSAVSSKYFIGLPIPMAASSIFSLVLIHPEPIEKKLYKALFSLLILSVSFLMISKIKFLSFKEISFLKVKNFGVIIFTSLLTLSLIYYTGYTVLFMLSTYLLFNIYNLIFSRKKEEVSEYKKEKA